MSANRKLVKVGFFHDPLQLATRHSKERKPPLPLFQRVTHRRRQKGFDKSAHAPAEAAPKPESCQIDHGEKKLSSGRKPVMEPLTDFVRDRAAVAEHPERINEIK